MKKDFIVRRSITMIEGKPHVETYSEMELVRCNSCLHFHQDNIPEDGCGFCELLSRTYEGNHYCADGERA